MNLHLSYCSGFEHINVSAPFLQFLQIESDEVIKSIRLKEAQDLILIQLFADGPGDNIDRAWVADLLEDSPNVERLFLGTSYIKVSKEWHISESIHFCLVGFDLLVLLLAWQILFKTIEQCSNL